MNKIIAVVLMIFFVCKQQSGIAQLTSNAFGIASSGTTTLASGIINKYQAISTASGNSFTASGAVYPGGSTPFAAGSKVLVIQMTGGSGAGTCEWARLNASATGFTTSLNNSYTSSGSAKAQMVAVPEYYDLVIPAGVTVTCSPWNGSAGAILVFNVNHHFILNGTCDVVGKGFTTLSHGTGGNGGPGGGGGLGGAIGTAGANGASTGTAFTGFAGGGNGAVTGTPANNSGTTVTALVCPGCGLTATNSSNLSTFPKKFVPGGAGAGGNGGLGTAGAGGGGGGGGGTTVAGTNGGNGGTGANGGDGGNGGNGGGIIIFTARTTSIAAGNRFLLNGITLPGNNGTNATNGGIGGNGGMGGGNCILGGGGGAGSGAAGGNGGNGGNGGAGGTLYYVYETVPAPLVSAANVLVNGSAGGPGGTHGTGGANGTNGGNLAGTNCTTPALPGPADCHLPQTGNCDFMCCLNALYSMRLGGSTPGTYTAPNGSTVCYRTYANSSTTVYIEQVSPATVLVTTSTGCYVKLTGSVSAINSLDKIFTLGLNTYAVATTMAIPPCTGSVVTGTLTDGPLIFTSECGGISCAVDGIDGIPGNNGGNGVFGGDPATGGGPVIDVVPVSCSSSPSITGFINCMTPIPPCYIMPGGVMSFGLSITGGTAPYSSSNTGATVSGSSITLNPSATGTIIITDANGCVSNAMTIPVCPPMPGMFYNFYVTATNISCFGANDGTINGIANSASPFGSAPSGGYTVTGMSGTTYGPVTHAFGNAVTGLAPGTYNVHWNGPPCLAGPGPIGMMDYVMIIYSPLAPIAAASIVTQPTSCTTGGMVNINVTGGTPDSYLITSIPGPIPTPPNTTGPITYTYTWSPALPVSAVVTNSGGGVYSVADLPPGTYTLTVKDTKNCSVTITVVISNPNTIDLTGTSTNENCTSSDGTASVNVTGGTAPFTYTWSSGQTTATATGLTHGNYTVTVTDANGCSKSLNITVGQIACPCNIILIPSFTPDTCEAKSGTASVVASGGPGSYSYSWNTIPVQHGPVATGLTGGTAYTVTVTSGTCTQEITITVPLINTPITLTGIPSCNVNGTTGNIIISMSGGKAPYNYTWSNGSASKDLINVPLGSYTVIVTDANGCVATGNFIIECPCNTILDISATPDTCTSRKGTSTVFVTGGTPPYTYSWNTSPVQTTATAVGLTGASLYTVTVTDATGFCSKTASITVPLENSTLSLSGVPVCNNGGLNGNITLTVSGGTAPYTFLWNNGATSKDLVAVTPGSYHVIVKDANGCEITGTYIIVCPPPCDCQYSGCTLAKDFQVTNTVSGVKSFTSGGAIELECFTNYQFDIHYDCQKNSCNPVVNMEIRKAGVLIVSGSAPLNYNFTTSGAYLISASLIINGKICSSTESKIIVNCLVDCCKGSFWKLMPAVYNSAGKAVATFDCNKPKPLYINPGNKNCNENLLVKGIFVCGTSNCKSKVVYTLLNSASIPVLGSANSITIPAGLPNGSYTLLVETYCDGKLCNECKFAIKKDCPVPCDCQTIQCKFKGFYKELPGSTATYYNCNSLLKLECNKPYAFGAEIYCKGNCTGVLNSTLTDSKGNLLAAQADVNNTLSLNYTFTTSGIYTLTSSLVVNGIVCNTCSAKIEINCTPSCNCGQWGSIGYSINGKANKFLCGTGTVLNANQGDIFTLLPQYYCTSSTGQPCGAVIKYDIYYPDGTSLLNQNSLQGFTLTKCGENKIVMTPTCGNKPCPPCEFIINVNCCSCAPALHPYLFWLSGSGDAVVDNQKDLECGKTYTNELECYQPYLIKVQSPCGANCQPDEVISTIKYTPAAGSGLSGYTISGSTLTANLPGTYEVTIKVKCNGVWCKECKIIFKQTKKCEPVCENCKDKVRAGFDGSSSTITADVHPAGSTVNASFMLGSSGDVFTQVRANLVDMQVSSDNPACLQCYNSPNNWGSMLNGSISLPGFSSAVSAYGGIPASNPGNSAREIIFNTSTPAAIPMGTTLSLSIKIPGANPAGCCCIKIVLFVKITYRNAKCEECSKILRISLKECFNGDSQNPESSFEPDGGWPQFRQHKPSPEDVKLMEETQTGAKGN